MAAGERACWRPSSRRLLADYFWIEPAGQFGIGQPADWLGLAIFLLSGAMIAWVTEGLLHARACASAAEMQVLLAAEREAAADALRASEAKYRDLFNNMTEEVHFWKLVRDRDGQIKTWTLVDANPPTLKTWGKTLAEIREGLPTRSLVRARPSITCPSSGRS